MSILDQYFLADTMSVHIKEWVPMLSKWWKPWDRHAKLWTDVRTKNDVTRLADSLLWEATHENGMFLEIDKQYSKVLQLGLYRIVIVYAPLVDTMEITVVRPVKKLSFDDYELSEDLKEHIRHKAKWILISGAPGEWKTTFAQALAEQYVLDNKIVKTLESPRDLLVPDAVSQYSFTYASHDEVRNILLLSRPDHALYDEVRNAEDFILYADLRLTGIGLVWVTHATKPVDSIQRFIWHVDMGSLPQVIDTVVFISAGKVGEVLTLEQVVKVPAGMLSQDLARPVLQVKDFFTQKPMYEIYSFGEQIVVMEMAKLKVATGMTPVQQFASKYLTGLLLKETGIKATVTILSDGEAQLAVPERSKWALIWKWGENIMKLEEMFGIKLSVVSWAGGSDQDEYNPFDEDEHKPSYRSGKGGGRPPRRSTRR